MFSYFMIHNSSWKRCRKYSNCFPYIFIRIKLIYPLYTTQTINPNWRTMRLQMRSFINATQNSTKTPTKINTDIAHITNIHSNHTLPRLTG